MKKITNPSDTVLIDPNEPLILPDGTALVGRIEWFLYALCCLDYQNLPTPMSRIEEFANALITGEIPNIQPQSRAEQFFLAILDGNISDLPQPQSRSEVLLDKLARGEFDLSDAEPIQSRYELLLAYLIKNGGIGNIDYVLYEFSEKMKTMYNTVEKPFKSLELSGNTLVNCVLEDTENDDYTSFDEDYNGTSFTINGTSEGAIKSAILKGNTLVNLLSDDKFEGSATIRGWDFTLSYPLTTNKTYLVIVNVTKDDTDYGWNCRFTNGTNYPIYQTDIKGTGIKKIKFTPSVELTKFSPYFQLEDWNNGKYVTLENMMVLEYQDGMENWDIPYFTGMQSVKLPVLTTTGKNLLNSEWEIGGLSFTDGSPINSQNSIKTKGFSLIPSNVELTISKDSNYYGQIFWYDENFNFISRRVIGDIKNTIASPTNAKYAKMYFDTTNTDVKVQVEEGSTATSYEPHKSNILTVNEDVTLRSNGDICDELNLLTGQLTQRIGEDGVVLSQEVVKTVDLNVVDQNNTKIDKIHVFDEVTHVNATSDELTPMVNIGKSVSYPTIIKPNTKYTVDLKRNDKSLTVNLGGTEVSFVSGETRKVITTPSTLTNDKLSCYGIGAKCNEIMLIEGEVEGNIDYFTGMQSVVIQNQMPTLHTVGKNLFSKDKVDFNKLYYSATGEGVTGTLTNASGLRCFTIRLKQNTNYTISLGFATGNLRIFATKDYPVLGMTATQIVQKQGGTQATFNTDDWNYFTVVYYSYNSDNTSGKTEEEVIATIQIEESSTKTTYESYKSSILSLPKDSRLRGIGDVQDTLDCSTGEVTQRIGEIVLDGSEYWIKESTNNVSGDTDTTTCYYTSINDIKLQNHCAFTCKELPYRKVTLYHKINDYEGISKCLNDRRIFIRINQSRLTEQNNNGFKQWLSQNPITIQYELETPVVTTIDLSIVDQDGNTIPKIKSYKDVTHLEVTVPKQSLLPNVSAEVATDNSKDMSSLTVKHQEISETQSAIEDNIQSQSDEIDTALMATTEIFESILE